MRVAAAATCWWLSCLPDALAFHRASFQVGATQSALLRRLLKRSANTVFGGRYEFEKLRTVTDFQRAVPLSRYEDYRIYLERVAAGERSVLTRDPVLLFEPTSGSLGGTKFIPYTAGLKRDFQRGLAPWIVDLFRHRPSLGGGRSYWSVSPRPSEGQRRWGRVPIGFEDDAAYLSGFGAALVRSMMAVSLRGDEGDFLDATLQQLIRCPDLRLISVWSPTFLILLMERMQGRHRWPRLGCISCWGDAYSAVYLPRLRELFPDVWIQPKGLISTEAFCTFPVVGRTGGALAVRSHFFEFLALDQVFLAHQLVAGEVYEVIVTTSGGLYRYRTGDRVRVVGHIRQCPMLVFEGRLGVVDHFGEKLSLSEVARALSGLSAMLAFEAEPAGYALFGESITLHDSERVESHLLDNFHYRYCRQLGQLAPLRAYRLDPGSLVPFYARLDALGLRAGDAKPLPLRHESNWSRWLPGRWLHSQAGSGAPLE